MEKEKEDLLKLMGLKDCEPSERDRLSSEYRACHPAPVCAAPVESKALSEWRIYGPRAIALVSAGIESDFARAFARAVEEGVGGHKRNEHEPKLGADEERPPQMQQPTLPSVV